MRSKCLEVFIFEIGFAETQWWNGSLVWLVLFSSCIWPGSKIFCRKTLVKPFMLVSEEFLLLSDTGISYDGMLCRWHGTACLLLLTVGRPVWRRYTETQSRQGNFLPWV